MERQTDRIANKQPLEYDVLIVNVPFRTAKSTFFTMCWNAWAWLKYPYMKFTTASYVDDLSVEHSFRTRKLIDSHWYTTVMKPKFYLTGDQNTKSYFENDKGGYRMAVSVGRGMGKGGDILIVDDPISREDSLSDVIRKKTLSWFFETLPSRRNDQMVSLIVLVMQRIHQDDPSGALIQHSTGLTYKRFCLPSDVEPGVHVEPKHLLKKYIKGVMFPSAFPKKVLDKLRLTLGSYTFNAQCRQMPAPPEGGIFNRSWWRFWKPRGVQISNYVTSMPGGEMFMHPQVDLPETFEDVLLSGDLGFKRTADSSRVALGKWGRVATDKYLLSMDVERMDYVTTKKRVLAFYNAHREATRFLIEDKANGPAVINDLSSVIPNLIGKSPGMESKVERASIVSAAHAVPMSAQCEAGHIYLPHPHLYPWVLEFIEEFSFFPNGSFDDMVDMSTQAINFWNVNDGDLGLYTMSQYNEEMGNNDKKDPFCTEVVHV